VLGLVSTGVDGQTVVDNGYVEVMKTVEWPGQLVTVGAHLVMVISSVVQTVDVVICWVEWLVVETSCEVQWKGGREVVELGRGSV
jgi:hypothetical protein